MTPLAKSDSLKIRKEIQDLSHWLQSTREEAEHKIVRLTNLVHRVQRDQLYKDWEDPAVKKPYRSFQAWIESEVGVSRAQVYRLIDVKEHLKLSERTLEEFGSSRCFELVKVAKERPKLLARFVEALKKKPDTPLYAVQQMVTNAVASGHFDSGAYERFSFAVKVEDALTIRKALMVIQAQEPAKNPDTDAARGTHLVVLCQEFLLGKEEQRILKKLEEAGAFVNGNVAFKIEE
jgi:hypothetical protein